MSLLERIQKDLVGAMKSKDEARLSAIRMIKTALKKVEVDSMKPLDEAAEMQVLNSFNAYSANFAGGVSVAAADVDGDGKADIVTGAGPGGGPNVTVYRFVVGEAVAVDNGQAQVLQSYFAYDSRFTAGVYVATGDVNGDGRADVVVGAGSGAGSRVTAYAGKSASPGGSPPELLAFDAFPGVPGVDPV